MKKFLKITGITLASIIGLIVIVFAIGVASENSEEKNTKANNFHEDLSKPAYAVSKNHVKNTLKSPSTAEFPGLDFESTKQDSATYLISSYVDAENSFGSMVRMNYSALLKYKGGDEYSTASWELMDITLNE